MNSLSWKVIFVSTAEYGPCPTLVRAATLTEYVVSGVNPRGKEYIRTYYARKHWNFSTGMYYQHISLIVCVYVFDCCVIRCSIL